MNQVLSLMADNKTRSVRDTVAEISLQQSWSHEELEELLASGSQTVAHSRVGWAITYLNKAGLLERPKRSQNRITAEGSRVAALPNTRIDNKFLRQYPEFVAFYSRGEGKNNHQITTLPEPNLSELSPEEPLDSAALSLQQSRAHDLLDKLKTVSPAFFERIVVDLLVSMGYRGSVKDAGKTARFCSSIPSTISG